MTAAQTGVRCAIFTVGVQHYAAAFCTFVWCTGVCLLVLLRSGILSFVRCHPAPWVVRDSVAVRRSSDSTLIKSFEQADTPQKSLNQAEQAGPTTRSDMGAGRRAGPAHRTLLATAHTTHRTCHPDWSDCRTALALIGRALARAPTAAPVVAAIITTGATSAHAARTPPIVPTCPNCAHERRMSVLQIASEAWVAGSSADGSPWLVVQ